MRTFAIVTLLFIGQITFVQKSYSQRFWNAYGYYSASNGYAITVDSSGYLLAGWFSIPNQEVIELIRVNLNGDTLWTVGVNEGFGTFSMGNKIVATDDGGFLISGRSDSSNVDRKLSLLKLRANGTVQWFKKIKINGQGNFWPGIDKANDNTFFLTEHDSAGCIVLKVDTLGNPIWAYSFNASSVVQPLSNVIQTSDSSIYFLLKADSFTMISKPVLMKLDKNGNYLWNKVYEGSSGYGLAENNIISNSQNGVVFTVGNTLVSTDSSGNIIWIKNFDLFGRISAINRANGGYCLAAYTLNSFGADYIIIRVDQAGNLVFTRTYHMQNNPFARSIEQTSDNGFLLGGDIVDMQNTQYFISIMKLDSNGFLGCPVDTTPIQIGIDSIYSYSTNISVSLCNSIVTIVNANGYQLIADFDNCFYINGQNEINSDNSIVIYPNPSNGMVRIMSVYHDGKVTLYDIYGNPVFKSDYNEQFNFSSFPNGFYFMYVELPDGMRKTFRLLLQK